MYPIKKFKDLRPTDCFKLETGWSPPADVYMKIKPFHKMVAVNLYTGDLGNDIDGETEVYICRMDE